MSESHGLMVGILRERLRLVNVMRGCMGLLKLTRFLATKVALVLDWSEGRRRRVVKTSGLDDSR